METITLERLSAFILGIAPGHCPSCGVSLEASHRSLDQSSTMVSGSISSGCSKCGTEVTILVRTLAKPLNSGVNGSGVSAQTLGRIAPEWGVGDTNGWLEGTNVCRRCGQRKAMFQDDSICFDCQDTERAKAWRASSTNTAPLG